MNSASPLSRRRNAPVGSAAFTVSLSRIAKGSFIAHQYFGQGVDQVQRRHAADAALFSGGLPRKTVQLAFTFGVGYNIVAGLTADFRMNMGLNDVYEGESLLIDLKGGKQMTFKFGIGYWFM